MDNLSTPPKHSHQTLLSIYNDPSDSQAPNGISYAEEYIEPIT